MDRPYTRGGEECAAAGGYLKAGQAPRPKPAPALFGWAGGRRCSPQNPPEARSRIGRTTTSHGRKSLRGAKSSEMGALSVFR